MIYWKLGCRWYSKSPLFFDYLVENEIVVSWTNLKFEINDIVLLTDGYRAIGIAKVLSEPTSILRLPQFHNDFQKLQIPTKEEHLLIFKAEIFQLSSSEQFIYKLQKGIRKIQKLEIKTITKNLIERKLIQNKMTNYTDLLHYKKQIILQGPPGTGKTRLAKEIALEMIGNTADIHLKNYLKKGSSIPNASGTQDYYLLENVTTNSVELSSQRATKKWSASFKKIQDKLSQLQRGESPKNKGGDDPYVLAVAKYVFENFKSSSDTLENNDQFKLIQFHPSYTYEDFVRGIVAESKGEKIEYKNVNKTLGLFAEEALNNFRDSKKDSKIISKEIRIKSAFEDFKEFINDEIEKSAGFYSLTDSVGLITTDDAESFRYKGKNEGWLKNGNRMLFKDILQAYSDGNTERQHLKKNFLVSGLARQHASYFIRVLNLFQEFIKKENVKIDSESNDEKIELKNFVLIIDEINRANLSSVLGELIYALEYREKAVESMYAVDDSILENKNQIILPPNLYIIGTMNTADRSVGHIDYAIRRRFAFVDVLPEELNDDKIIFQKELFKAISALFINNYEAYIADKNTKLERAKSLAAEFRPQDVWLGHSYFIQTKEVDKDGKEILVPEDFNIRLEYEIKPILMEYVKDGILINTIKVGENEIKVEDYIKSL